MSTRAGGQRVRRCRRAVAAPVARCSAQSGTRCSGRCELLDLPDRGVKLELARETSVTDRATASLLFLHGTSHGAWCWSERFMPYMCAKGFDCYAVSWRGHGESPLPAGIQPGKPTGTVQEHVEDLRAVVRLLPNRPVLVAHSLAALVVAQYMVCSQQPDADYPAPQAVVLMSPFNVYGVDMSKRMASAPIESLQITWSFISQNYFSNTDIFRKMFLTNQLPDEEVRRLQSLMVLNKPTGPAVDVRAVRKLLPLPPLQPESPCPALVIAGSEDRLSSVEDAERVSEYFGCDCTVIDKSGHDLMLDKQWEQCANVVIDFVKTNAL